MLKWFRKKESIELGGKYLTSKAMPGIAEIGEIYKYPKSSGKWHFRVVSNSNNYSAFKFKLKREADTAREKLIKFYEKWR